MGSSAILQTAWLNKNFNGSRRNSLEPFSGPSRRLNASPVLYILSALLTVRRYAGLRLSVRNAVSGCLPRSAPCPFAFV